MDMPKHFWCLRALLRGVINLTIANNISSSAKEEGIEIGSFVCEVHDKAWRQSLFIKFG